MVSLLIIAMQSETGWMNSSISTGLEDESQWSTSQQMYAVRVHSVNLEEPTVIAHSEITPFSIHGKKLTYLCQNKRTYWAQFASNYVRTSIWPMAPCLWDFTSVAIIKLTVYGLITNNLMLNWFCYRST
jgi:hypothetical protein